MNTLSYLLFEQSTEDLGSEYSNKFRDKLVWLFFFFSDVKSTDLYHYSRVIYLGAFQNLHTRNQVLNDISK